ncbi:hypothetical protein IJ768_00950 [Candidatus Saccharibacteria bacterium]|nr:hypothetical protein [Candidatus Saccharibacteria bacterium]
MEVQKQNNENQPSDKNVNQWEDLKNVPFSGEITNSPKEISLQEFYENIKNPLEDDAVMNSIIEAYSKKDGVDIYSALQKIGIDDKEKMSIVPADKQHFEEKMYAKWHNSVVGISKETYLKSKKEGILGEDFPMFRKFIKLHPECRTNEELIDAMKTVNDKKDSDELFDAYYKYGWKLSNGWNHVKSRYVNARQEDRIIEEHRLYLNTDSTSTYSTIDALVDIYEKHNVPYYFKFDEPGNRADTIVIYTSTEYLTKNLAIIEELQQEHPELADKMHEPPILTGKIREKIGYGAEPEKSSYSDVRARILENVLNETTASWVSKHKDDIIRSGGKEMKFSDYVVDKQVKYQQEKMRKRLENRIQTEKNYLTHNRQNFNETDIVRQMEEKVGYTYADLEDNSKMLQIMQERMRERFDSALEILQRSPKEIDKADFVLTNRKTGKEVTINEKGLSIALERITPEISRHDSNYLDEVRKKTMQQALASGIDKKFAFDNSTVTKMKVKN